MNTSVSDMFSLIMWELVIIIFIMIMMAVKMTVVFCVLNACDGDDDGDGDFGAGSDADIDCDADGDCESAWHIAAASCLRPNKRTASLLEPIFTFHDILFVNSFIDTNDLSREGPPKMAILGLSPISNPPNPPTHPRYN